MQHNVIERHALGDAIATIRQHMEERRHPIAAEIRNYPPPITGCDAQFNHLVAQRDEIIREIAELDGLDVGDAERRLAVVAFLDRSPFFDEAAKTGIKRTLEDKA